MWGKIGSEIDDDLDMDTNDPNYDSDSLENGTIELKKIIPEVCVDSEGSFLSVLLEVI